MASGERTAPIGTATVLATPRGDEAEAAPGSAVARRRRFDSADLFGASVEVEIVHAQQVYRLRRTAQGKLILTK